MQVNLLNHLKFPPGAPNVTNGPLDAVGTGAQDVSSRAHRAAAAPRAPEPTPQGTTEASVKLDLDHSQRAQAAVTYGPDGLFAGKSGIEVASTPAEQFVATAVEIMRTYQQDHAQPVSPGALDRLRQVVSRFSARA